MKLAELEEQQVLELNNELTRTIYQHVQFLCNHRYRSSIEYLKQRNKSYDIEDFEQDVMQKLLDSIKTMKFTTLPQLKKFINKVIQFHYLYEKRKYFQIKSRAKFQEESLDSIIDDNRELLDVLYKESDINFDNLQLKILYERNLYFIFSKDIKVCNEYQLFNYTEGKILSANSLLKVYYEKSSELKTIQHFKNNGLSLTKKTLRTAFNTLYNYCKENNILDL